MISIVLPAFNEEKAIAQSLRRIQESLDSTVYKYEIIVVDDGSTDNTSEIARALGAIVVEHPHNIGYGKSIKDGIRQAKYDSIVIMDADGTYPAHEISTLILEFAKGFDMVVGRRTGAHFRGSPLKWQMRILLKFLVEWSCGREIPDINSGFRIFSRKKITSYFPQLCDTFSFTTTLTLAYMMTNRFVSYVPIEYGSRIGKTHVRLWRDSLRTFQFVLQTITYYNPLKIFVLLSLLCFFGALISIAIGITYELMSGFLMGALCISIGVLGLALGLFADLIRQTSAKNQDDM